MIKFDLGLHVLRRKVIFAGQGRSPRPLASAVRIRCASGAFEKGTRFRVPATGPVRLTGVEAGPIERSSRRAATSARLNASRVISPRGKKRSEKLTHPMKSECTRRTSSREPTITSVLPPPMSTTSRRRLLGA